ncbi:MAG: hypothetical protein ACTSX8_09410 [Alphaproteobacteria bacterium]
MRYLIALCLACGCVSMSAPVKLNQKQFQLIQKKVEDIKRASPPSTPAEAERLASIYNVAAQGIELTRVHLKKVGPAKTAVPDPADFDAVKDFTDRYEHDVERENRIRSIAKNYLASRFGWGDGAQAGGIGAIALTAFGMWMKKRKSDLVARQTFTACEKLPDDVRRTIVLPKEAREAHANLNDEWKAKA